jgi:hypothetical protein
MMTPPVERRRTRPVAPCLWLCILLLACSSEGEPDRDTDADVSNDEAGADAAGAPGLASDAGQSGDAQGSPATGNTDAAAVDAGTAGAAQDAGGVQDAAGSVLDAGKSDAAAGTDGGTALERFSFFVTSQDAIVALAGNAKGFGGDLRHGETGSGAGLRGADKICGEIAERSMPGAAQKQWRAFLSASSGGASGGAVHARDRIGQGPWYDRKGRLAGNALADLLSGDRPANADAMIRDDLPNESGVPNRTPNGTQLDNHDTLTGSDASGRFVAGSNTCQDWTSASTSTGGGGGGGGSGPAIGHSWPRSATNGRNWVSDHRAGGCGAGINTSNGSTDGTPTVGSGGGYGGFYCFALTP